jgi:putative photosynthetic complex assembly protein 2
VLHYSAAVVFVILAWWLSTGTILIAAGRQTPRIVPVMAAATAIAMAGFAGLWISSGMADGEGVYLGFLSALAIWAWHEASFLTGLVTGPRRQPCPANLSGYARFKAAFEAIRDHELAIAATGIVIVGLSAGAENRIGMWTFLLLWGMRITAKLVLFLGAPHVAVAMLPPRLAYMASYFRTDRISAVFPAFVIAMTFAFALLCHAAATAAELHDGVTATMLATFLALAIIEHLFLVFPVSDAALWRWAMPEQPDAQVPNQAPNQAPAQASIQKPAAGTATRGSVNFAGGGIAASRPVTGEPAVKAAAAKR